MEESALFGETAVRGSEIAHTSRHSATVRVTHWIVTLSFFGLLVSGIAILEVHPHLYWGETGGYGASSLIDLPIPLVPGQSGWGRSLHFLSAWICVLTGIVYLVSGFLSRHFYRHLMPVGAKLPWGQIGPALWAHLRWSQPNDEELLRYNLVQRIAYLAVIFLVFPLIVLSGLAMSPAITSVVPELVESFGGQQSARTVHFFAANILVLFVIVHLAMVCRPGFLRRMRAMITGNLEPRKALPRILSRDVR